MRIIRLQAENLKRLVAVDIAPSGDVIHIRGKNGAGKTTVLDAIWWALGGTQHIQGQAVRQGQDKARVEIELGGGEAPLVVERRWTQGGEKSSLRVYHKAEVGGVAIKHEITSPQKVLNQLLERRTFDPLEFLRSSPKDQAELLRRLGGIDTSELNARYGALYEERRDLNRERQRAKTRAEDAWKAVPEDAPTDFVSVKALLEELESAEENNAEIEAAAEAVELTRAAIDTANERINGLLEEIEGLKREINLEEDNKALQEATLVKNRAEVEKLNEIDTYAIRNRIEEAEDVNESVARRRGALELDAEVEALDKNVEKLEERMAEIDCEKQERLAEADLPLEGLSVDGDQVTFNGLPLANASHAEALKISTAIAMKLKPALRVLRITDGSLLDRDSMAVIEALCGENDFQAWIEEVGEDAPVGVLIEDGAVASVDGIRRVVGAPSRDGSASGDEDAPKPPLPEGL